MVLALREMRRAKLRFALLTGAVGLLVFLILFLQTLLGGLIEQFIGAVRHQSATVLVYGDQARRNIEGSTVTLAQVEAVGQVDGVAEAAPLGQGTFTVTAGGSLTDAVMFGYQLGGPGAPTRVVKGRAPTRPGEAVASEADAPDGFDIGDVVTVAPTDRPIEVVGLTRDSNYSVSPTLFVPYATLVQAKEDRNPDARGVLPSLVAVTTDQGADPAEVAARITAQVPGVEALDRATAVKESPGVASVQQSFAIILFLAFTVVTLVTGFFFLILTVQKAQALTLLRAIGVRARTLAASLLVQVTLVVLGGIAVATLALAGAAAGSSSGFAIRVEPGLVLRNGAVVLVLALLASLVAVRRVLRIDPIRATQPGGVDG